MIIFFDAADGAVVIVDLRGQFALGEMGALAQVANQFAEGRKGGRAEDGRFAFHVPIVQHSLAKDAQQISTNATGKQV